MDFFAHPPPPRFIQKISTGTQQCFVSTMNVLFILQVGGVADRDLRIVCESSELFAWCPTRAAPGASGCGMCSQVPEVARGDSRTLIARLQLLHRIFVFCLP
jgi:hypothetical protein